MVSFMSFILFFFSCTIVFSHFLKRNLPRSSSFWYVVKHSLWTGLPIREQVKKIVHTNIGSLLISLGKVGLYIVLRVSPLLLTLIWSYDHSAHIVQTCLSDTVVFESHVAIATSLLIMLMFACTIGYAFNVSCVSLLFNFSDMHVDGTLLWVERI